jgi:hypothetical protein
MWVALVGYEVSIRGTNPARTPRSVNVGWNHPLNTNSMTQDGDNP